MCVCVAVRNSCHCQLGRDTPGSRLADASSVLRTGSTVFYRSRRSREARYRTFLGNPPSGRRPEKAIRRQDGPMGPSYG